MDYFFSKIGRGIRYGASIVGAAAGLLVIVLGILGINSILIPISGGVAIIPAAFILVENVKVIRDMEKLVTKLKSDLKSLREQIDIMKEANEKLEKNVTDLTDINIHLSEVKDNLVSNISKLESLLDESEQKVEELSDLVFQYKETSEKLNRNLDKAKINNAELQKNVNDLIDIKREYENQIESLNTTVKIFHSELDIITKTKDEYEIEINKLITTNKSMENTVKILETDLEENREICRKAKLALKTLIETQDVFTGLKDDMVETEKQTEENVSRMDNLVKIFGEERTKELFEQLDKNHDQVLSMDEFVNFIIENVNEH
jgi:chromosome segregation ATPase